jgi:hypothetical protein
MVIAVVADQPGEALLGISAGQEALDRAFDVAGDEAACFLGGLDQSRQVLPSDALQELDGGALVVDGRGHGHG